MYILGINLLTTATYSQNFCPILLYFTKKFTVSEANRTNYEGILKMELFDGYDPDVKRTVNASDPFDIALALYLHQIENLIENVCN